MRPPVRDYNDLNNYNNRQNVNLNNEPDNRVGMTLPCAPRTFLFMKTYRRLFDKLTDYDNLLLAFQKAKKRKSKKQYVIDFEKELPNELFKLQWELLTGTYKPRPLTTFTVRDPKTRRISSSHFRDRVIHHAICNVIEPIFEKRFIYDTYANRKGKGTLAALNRFDFFIHKATRNGMMRGGAIPKTGMTWSVLRSKLTSNTISRPLTTRF